MLRINFPRVPKVNWWYAFGELTIVVAGILIALGVNSWWADKQLARWEKQTIIDLHAEFESNRRPIIQFIQLYSHEVELAEALFTQPHSIRDLPDKERAKVFVALVFTPTFDPADAYLTSLIRAGELYKISDRQLRILIAQWVDVNEDLAENCSSGPR